MTFIAVMLFAVSLAAQTSRGTLTGTVTDSSGAVVPNATVEITDKATNVKRSTTSNAVGAYRFDAVNLGTYRLDITASGFSGFTVDNVIITANRTLELDANLKVGATGESVTVEASAEQVQTTEQVHLASISARKLADLPVQAQNSLNLILVAPGVVSTDLGGSLSSGIGSVNGSRPRGNNFLIDGVENNDISVAGPAITQTNNDAIQELAIQTSNFSAEFGRAGGAVVNQVTKSGTNSLHGTLAYVYRSEVFNASNQDERNAFVPGGPDPLKAKFLEHIPAFTIGGPVVIPGLYNGKNRTFFFGAGQWDRLNQGGSITTFTVPTAAGVATLQALASAGCTRAQLYLNSIDGLVAPTQNATISLALPSATGACNGTNRAGMSVGVGLAGRTVPSFAFNDNHTVRVDHKLTDKQQMSVRWLYTNTFQNNATVAVSRFFDADVTDRSMSLALTHTYAIKPSMTNEFRFNYGRINPNFPISNAGIGTTLPRITFANSQNLAGVGTTTTFPQGRTANNWQYQDVISVVKGNHQIRFGVDFLRQLARQTAPANIRGTLTYTGSTGGVSGLSNFLDDFGGSTGSPSISFGTPTYRPNLFRQAYFVQDAWKVLDTLTLNLGLRYENFGQPANIFTLPVISLDPATFGTPSKVKQDNNNFGPTVGFAWAPRDHFKWLAGDNKLVVRGGFQVSYDAFFNNLLSNIAGSSPNLVGPVPIVPNLTLNPRGTPNMSQALATMVPAPLNPLADVANQFSPNIVNPYTMRFSFGIQRELPSAVILDVSYVGALGRKLFTTQELNPFLPNATNTGRGSRLNPAMGARQPRLSGASSNFNSLQVEVKRGLKETPIGGITFSGAYTWSKSMDTSSEAFTTNSVGSVLGSSRRLRLLSNSRLDYGPSDFDVAHRFVSTLVWDVRGPKDGAMGQIFGGWTLSFVTPLQTGFGYDIINGTDRDFDGSLAADRPDVGNWNAPITSRARIVPVATCTTGLQNPAIGTGVGQGCVTANDVRWVERGGGTALAEPSGQTMRRNAARTPGSMLVHMNVLKSFRITERWKFEYRAEIFNLTNTQNLNYVPWPTAIVSDPGPFLDYFQGRPAGSASTESRTMRMGIKVIF